MIKRLCRKLLFILYLTVVTFTLLEICVRFWGYSEHHLCDPIYMPLANAQGIPYVHKPNLSNARARGLAVINTDELGLRAMIAGEHHGHHQNQEYRIALVGDSVTFGEGVSRTQDTFAQVLEETLNRAQSDARVKVFNFGASAYSVSVMEATLRQRMPTVEPDLVLMAVVPADFNLSRTPDVDAWGYLYDGKLGGVLPLDSSLRPVLRKVHLFYLLRDLIYPWLDRSRSAEQFFDAHELPDSYFYVTKFKETAEQQRHAYSLVLLPSRNSDFGNMPSQLHQDGIPFLDLSTLRDQFTQDQFQASKFDVHPSPLVHRRIGEALAAYILDNHLVKTLKTPD
jgi:hypothetical protein